MTHTTHYELVHVIQTTKLTIKEGTWVRFSNESKFYYSKLLKEMYEKILQWAYEGDKMKMPGDIIKKCISNRKRFLLTMKAFSTIITYGKSQ